MEKFSPDTNDYKGKLRDVSPYDGSIYTFDEDSNSFVPYFKWNLGKYNMPAEVIDKEVARGRSFFYFSDELPKILKEKYITCCKNTCESDNYVISLFSITTYDSWMTLVYNKKTNTSYCFDNELGGGHYFCPDGPVYDNVLYRVMPFFGVRDQIDVNWLQDEESIRAYNSVSPLSNAYVIKYYLK